MTISLSHTSHAALLIQYLPQLSGLSALSLWMFMVKDLMEKGIYIKISLGHSYSVTRLIRRNGNWHRLHSNTELTLNSSSHLWRLSDRVLFAAAGSQHVHFCLMLLFYLKFTQQIQQSTRDWNMDFLSLSLTLELLFYTGFLWQWNHMMVQNGIQHIRSIQVIISGNHMFCDCMNHPLSGCRIQLPSLWASYFRNTGLFGEIAGPQPP